MHEKKAVNVEIGMRIQRARERAGLTQDALAERVGLEPKSVSAIERGVVGISVPALRRVCEVLRVSADALLFGAESDARDMAAQLERLTPRQLEIARRMFEGLLEAFSM